MVLAKICVTVVVLVFIVLDEVTILCPLLVYVITRVLLYVRIYYSDESTAF